MNLEWLNLKVETLFINNQNKQATKVHITVIRGHIHCTRLPPTSNRTDLDNVADYKVSIEVFRGRPTIKYICNYIHACTLFPSYL